jgi:GT2 family glycosyltransferase
MKLDVSIMIVNWNTRDLLVRCLRAVYDTIRGLEFEVIVVDNASTDDSVATLREQFAHVRLIENQENVGFARANNQAINAARGRYVLLLNSDAFLHTGAVETLVEYMDQHAEVGAAGCMLFYEDGTLQRSCSAFPTVWTELWQALWLDRLFPTHPLFGKYWMMYWKMDDARQVDVVMGACMMLRRQALEQVGLLDEQFFMYSEEVDLCYRLKQAGWQVCFVPEATATHIWGGTARKVQREETFLRLYASRALFFRKHYGRLTTLLYKWVLALGSLLRVVIGPLAAAIRNDEYNHRSSRNYGLLLRSLWAF